MTTQTTLAINCSCGRRLTVPRRLGGQRVKCVGCNRSVAVPGNGKSQKPTRPKQPKRKAPPLPIAPRSSSDTSNARPKEEERDSQRFAGFIPGLIAGILATLLLCLLLWWFWGREPAMFAGSGSQNAATAGTAEQDKSGTGEEPNADDKAPSAQKVDEEDPNQAPDAPDIDVEKTDEPVEDPALVDETEKGATSEKNDVEETQLEGGSSLESEAADEKLSQQPTQGGTRKTITGLTEATVAGVKVYGSIGLVCDFSGSMAADLPNLIKELRKNFPPDTPLIFVRGCRFVPPAGSTPYKGAPSGVWGLGQDPHVYTCSNTTDAIVYAARELNCDTVMFNNDMKDGGTLSAIQGLRRVHKRTQFRLSGRSLEHNAPQDLLDFIEETGGDFVVDPIYRPKKNAVNWWTR